MRKIIANIIIILTIISANTSLSANEQLAGTAVPSSLKVKTIGVFIGGFSSSSQGCTHDLVILSADTPLFDSYMSVALTSIVTGQLIKVYVKNCDLGYTKISTIELIKTGE